MKPIKLNNDPDFSVYNVGTDKIELDRYLLGELVPTECYIKTDGAIGDKPILCFILENKFGKPFVAQISLKMFKPVIEELRLYME